jgi:hypothetical protein
MTNGLADHEKKLRTSLNLPKNLPKRVWNLEPILDRSDRGKIQYLGAGSNPCVCRRVSTFLTGLSQNGRQ